MNYIASCRTNYFAVKNEVAFKEWCNNLGVTFIQSDTLKQVIIDGRRYNLVGFYNDQFFGGVPISRYDKEADDYIEIEFYEELRQHLAPGTVAIVQEIGQEGMRYFTGCAVAINSKGRTVSVGIEDIESKARRLTNHPRFVTKCQY